MSSIWPANALTGGGTGALDAIDGGLLSDGDGAVVIAGTTTYFYSLDGTSGATESGPNVIAPDVNAGDKRWILQDVRDNSPITLNKNAVTSDTTIPTGYNACSVGPLVIDANVTINGVWKIL